MMSPRWALVTETSSRYLLHARLLRRAAPGWTALCLLATTASAAAKTLALLTTGRLVGELPAVLREGADGAAADRAWTWLWWTAVAFVASPVFMGLADAMAQRVSARYLETTFDMLLEVGTHPYGVAPFDDPKLTGRIDGLHQAMRDWTFVMGVDSTWVVVSTRLAGVGALVVVSTWSWWVGLVLMVGYLLMSKVVTTWINTFYDDLLDVTGNARRQATYLRRLLTDGATGKEVRLFGLSSHLLDRFQATWMSAMALVWRNRSRTVGPVVAVLSVAFVLNAGAFALLAHDAVGGAVSLGALATLAQGLLALESFGPMGDPQSALARNTAAARELVAVRRLVGLPVLPDDRVRLGGMRIGPRPRHPVREHCGLAPDRGPAQPAATVELDDVTFTYPARSEPAFRNLSLRIPAGQSVAVVGVNGAGKSTLIKLLCGLYPADSGTVRVAGADPAADPRARARVAVIFQDFVHYHLSLRDNVGFGAVGRLDDERALASALTDAGGGALLARLPQDWDTVLSPEYAAGTDLSGGQWQRVALARAFAAIRGGAGVLVLDEPTAALDVRAEAALFDRFLEVTRGLTTILVSHRLSSVRHADRIVVLDPGHAGNGAIVEDGSHEELMALGGEYAAMFALQASRFNAAGADREELAR
ncbi:MAG TPA: ABC transporter ATP-binding protein [Nocardioidaceae bacterium]|nr:ABC transporter ATP-binding protein [Nocardioidaceae bacterium]